MTCNIDDMFIFSRGFHQALQQTGQDSVYASAFCKLYSNRYLGRYGLEE